MLCVCAQNGYVEYRQSHEGTISSEKWQYAETSGAGLLSNCDTDSLHYLVQPAQWIDALVEPLG